MEVSSTFLSSTSVQVGYDNYGPVSEESSQIIPLLNGPGNKRKLSDDELNDRPVTRPRMADQEQSPPEKKVIPPGPDHSTGIVYDPRMRFHVTTGVSSQALHPEDPRRIAKIMHALENEDLVYRVDSGGLANQYPRRIHARDVTDDELLRVHTRDHLAVVASLKRMTEAQLKEIENDPAKWDSLYACKNTETAARLAAGGTIDICKAVMRGELKNGFAVVRPPGHHAEPTGPRGFCWYNNVSIAAMALLEDPELECRRILVVDWDIHHGNGIQATHYGDSNVLYVSLHRNDPGFYPCSTNWGAEAPINRDNDTYGDRDQNGEGEGLGFNINVPWSGGGKGDGDYLYAFDQVVLPIAREYNPDIIVIASGFDAAAGDELGKCHVSDAGYAYLTHQLMGVTNKVVAVLEGGYNMTSIALSAVGVVKALLGRPLPRLPNSLPSSQGVQDVDLVVQRLRTLNIWNTLAPRQTAPTLSTLLLGAHEIIRQWQISQMWERYSLYPLYIPQPTLLPLFQRTVLATPEFGSREIPLLVVFHEPLDVFHEPLEGEKKKSNRRGKQVKRGDTPDDETPDPLTGEGHPRPEIKLFAQDEEIMEALDNSDARNIDTVGSYIDDAIRMGFDVIDVHLPNVAVVQEAIKASGTSAHTDAATETLKLVTYVFDHYIKPSNASHIFVMATELGHTAMARYMVQDEIFAMDRITHTFHFLLQAKPEIVLSPTNDGLIRWYHMNSSVFVHIDNSFWSKKPKPKYGGTVKTGQSANSSMRDMLTQCRARVAKHLATATDMEVGGDVMEIGDV